MNTTIEVCDVSYKYPDHHWALKHINFEVRQGEILGIVGPNGSGKSTLLKLLSGVLKPVDGQILLFGRHLTKLKHKIIAQMVAVVPQNTVINFPFTTYEIVLMGRAPHLGLLQIERKNDFMIVERAMQYTNSIEFAQRRINELSGGERQRVIIARALAQEPQIILLDEPTAHLDLKYQVEIFDLIKRLNRENLMTVVVVSHDLNLAGEYCDRLILLKDGEVYKTGFPKQVITEADIQAVYDIEVLVSPNPMTGAPHITLVGKEFKKDRKRENGKTRKRDRNLF